jgi:glycosyltransferase involved in cell wall biosynthesis
MSETSSSAVSQVLVLQNGARHNYAVPLALARAGRLAGFYTDGCGNVGLGKLAGPLSKLPFIGNRFSLLARRQIPPEVLPFTHSFPLASLAEQLDPGQRYRNHETWFGWQMEAAGRRGADLIYSSMGWAPEFLKHSRELGIPILAECYVRPSLWRTHQNEQRLFPDWEPNVPYADFTESTVRAVGPWRLADDLIVPTEAVRQELIAEGLFEGDHIHVVPYGIGPEFFEISNQPELGHVLYVGSATLVKGIHYLAGASQGVTQTDGMPKPRFSIAGEVSHQVRDQPSCARLDFLGRVPRTEVYKLFARADVFVFPSLSDSFGMVILEAMAAGLPVICSPYCADVVRDGVDGFIVEPRDTQALADAISRLIGDRKLRQRFSESAKARAREYGWQQHGERLVQLTSRLTNPINNQV